MYLIHKKSTPVGNHLTEKARLKLRCENALRAADFFCGTNPDSVLFFIITSVLYFININ